jgi:hypothetical protein
MFLATHFSGVSSFTFSRNILNRRDITFKIAFNRKITQRKRFSNERRALFAQIYYERDEKSENILVLVRERIRVDPAHPPFVQFSILMSKTI